MKWLKRYSIIMNESKVPTSQNKEELEWEMTDEMYEIDYDSFLKDFSYKEFFGIGLTGLQYINVECLDPKFEWYVEMPKSSNEFINRLVKLVDYGPFINVSQFYDDTGWKGNFEWFKRNLIIILRTDVGGVSGGSCWDDSDPREYNTNNDITFDDFYNEFRPKLKSIIDKYMNFLDADKLIDEMKKKDILYEDSYTEYEYYGNCTYYKCIYVKFYDLYKFLGDYSTF